MLPAAASSLPARACKGPQDARGGRQAGCAQRLVRRGCRPWYSRQILPPLLLPSCRSYFTATASADGSPATAIATLFEHAGNGASMRGIRLLGLSRALPCTGLTTAPGPPSASHLRAPAPPAAVEWSLNATDIAPGPLTVSIVDGNPETSVAPGTCSRAACSHVACSAPEQVALHGRHASTLHCPPPLRQTPSPALPRAPPPAVVLLWSGEAEGADFEAAGEFNASDLAPTSMSVTIDDLKGHMGMGHIYLEVASGETKLYGAFAQTAEDGGPLEEAGMGHGMAPGAAPMEDHAGHDEPVAEAADGHDHAADEHAGHSHRRMLA